jgi:cell division protease FtsH
VFVGGASRVKNLFKKAREYTYAEGACMDGLDNKKSNVIVIAATNVDKSVLDKAL